MTALLDSTSRSRLPAEGKCKPRRNAASRFFYALGEAMRHHQRLVQACQWTVVLVYLVLVSVPAFLPLPGRTAHIWNNLTLFAQFAFWGLWWPFVLLSMVLFGRAWCGIFCPEGALSEAASRIGRAMPSRAGSRGGAGLLF